MKERASFRTFKIAREKKKERKNKKERKRNLAFREIVQRKNCIVRRQRASDLTRQVVD